MTDRNELRAEIEIDADPDSVWAVLMDFEAYPEWNPFIQPIEGSQVGRSHAAAPDPATGQPRDDVDAARHRGRAGSSVRMAGIARRSATSSTARTGSSLSRSTAGGGPGSCSRSGSGGSSCRSCAAASSRRRCEGSKP